VESRQFIANQTQGVFTVPLLEELARPRKLRVRSSVVFTVGMAAIFVVSLLWLAGADRVIMTMFLVFISFPLVAFLAYVSDRDGGRISARRGTIVGALSFPLWAAWVICKSSYERRGIPYPNTVGELFLIVVFSAFFMCFGASVGIMAGVIIGRVSRLIGAFAFSWSRNRANTHKRELDKLMGSA
jgi:hypothetical protein